MKSWDKNIEMDHARPNISFPLRVKICIEITVNRNPTGTNRFVAVQKYVPDIVSDANISQRFHELSRRGIKSSLIPFYGFVIKKISFAMSQSDEFDKYPSFKSPFSSLSLRLRSNSYARRLLIIPLFN